MDKWSAREGSPSPLGVTWIEEEQAFNFALHSRHATGVTLLLYSCNNVVHPACTYRLDPLTNKSGRVWHCRLKASSIPACSYYAYTVSGPNEPGTGQRFDDQKILIDPYARSL